MSLSDSAGLPGFFQFQGQSISDGLLEFEELGGDLEDVVEESEEPTEAEFNDEAFGGPSISLNDLMKDLPKPPSHSTDLPDLFQTTEKQPQPPAVPLNSAPVVGQAAAASNLKKLNPAALFNKGVANAAPSYASAVSGLPAAASADVAAPNAASSTLLKVLKGDSQPSQPGVAPAEGSQQPQLQSYPQPMPPLGFQLPPPGANGPLPMHMAPPPFMFGMHPPPGAMPPPGMMLPMVPPPGNFAPPGPGMPNMPLPARGPPPPHYSHHGGRPLQPPHYRPHYQSQQQGSRPPPLPTGQKMGQSEVTFVYKKTVDPMQTVDPFADDYYNIQFKIKKNEEMRDQAVKNNAPLPPMLFIPLPTWKDTKDRIRQQIEDTKNHYHERARKWVEKEKVLGQNIKSDISRPKEVLSVPSLSELMTDDADMDGSLRAPYSSRLWNMRQAVQKGYEALYTVQELQYLLHTPVVVANVVSHGEIIKEIDTAINILAQSLGIRVHAAPSSETESSRGEISLEGGLVAAILQTAKGKRLLSRSLQLLPPDHRWALLPAILARILQVDPSEQQEEDKTVEQKLIKTLLEFVNHTHQFLQDLQAQKLQGAVEGWQPPVSPDKFAHEFLANLRQCVKSVMVSFMEKSQLRQALLSSRARAEVMHIIVQVGDKVSDQVDDDAVADWVHLREAFMSMLDN